MHIKRLLSGSLAALMVASSFNVPVVRAAEDEPTKVVEEAKVDTSGDDDVIVDDGSEKETEETTEVSEPEETPVVEEPAGEAASGEVAPVETTPEVVVEEAGEQEVVGAETEFTFTLTLNANGGKIDGSDTKTLEAVTIDDSTGASVNISGNTPVREGYTFKGWADDSEATTATLDKDATTYTKTFTETPTADATGTLYAVWAMNEITVKYDKNNTLSSEAAGTTTDTIATYTGGEKFAANGFIAPEGKKFKEWNTAADGTGTAYEAGAEIPKSLMTSDQTPNLTVYAIWEDKANISAQEITVTGFTYCKEAKAPTVNVKDLTIDDDYTVEVWTTGDSAAKVDSGKVTDAGNYKVKIIGKGDYTGTVEKEFTVEKKELTVTLGVDKGPSGDLSRNIYKENGTDGALLNQYALYYNAEAIGTGDNEKAKGTVAESINPYITIDGIETGDAELKEKTESVTDGNYTVTRPTNTDKVGKASITFAFVENAELAKNYKFPTKVEYEIVDPSEFDDSMAIAENANPQAEIKDGGAVDGTWKAYTATYGKLVTKTIPKVDMSETLTFIRGKRITGNAANLSVSGVYDINGKKLEEGEGKDYTVAITENDKKDTYTAVITFAGNYNGTWTITSPVVDAETASATYEKKITKATFAHDGEVIWVNGLGEEGKAGTTEVTIDGKKVALSNAIADLGKANYVGVIPQLNSTISEISVGDDNDGIFDFKGSEIKPTVTLKDTYSEPNTIDPKNYKLTYAGHNKVNDAAKVTVTMNSDLYEGTTSGTFKIVDKKEQVETPDVAITGNTSTEGDKYSLGSKVELYTITPGAQIYYTISSTAADAKTITSENYATVGKLYTDAIELEDTQIYSSDITINAIAVKDGWDASYVLTYTFPISNPTKDWGEVVDEDQSQWGNDATTVPDGIWVGDASKKFNNYPDSVAMYDGYAKKFYEMQGYKDGNRVVYNKNYGLRVYYHKTLLTPNDYTIKYANNVNAWKTGYSQYVASKQPTFTITGKGQFTGGFIGHFDIHPMVNKYDYNSETVYNVYVEPTSATSLAEKDKPQTVKVKAYRYNNLNGKKITLNLKENTDYTVAYTDVKTTDDTTDDLLTAKAGKKRATITFRGNYEGFDTTDYEVVAVDKFLEKATVKIDDSAVVFDGNDQASKVKFSVKLGATELVQDTDFKVTYEPTDKNFLEWREENTTSDYADSEKLMTAGGYQVKLCGIGNYSGTKVVKQTFKGGTAITNSKVKLTNATDIKKITFKQDANVIVSKFEDTTGPATKKLVAGKDYVILYKGNDKVTTSAKAIVLGMGAYSGSKTLTYAVQGIKLSDIKSLITIDSKDYDYVTGYWGGYNAKAKYYELMLINDGDPIDHKGSIIHIPNGTGIDGDGEFDDVDMSVGKKTNKAIWVSTTAASIKNAGKYNIVLEGNPEMGYTGKITVPFVINPVDTENLKLTVGTKTTVDDKDIWTAEYTGTSAAPDVKWGNTGVSLNSTDIKNNFTVKYAPNKVAAGQSVKITLTPKAKKNFTGSALTFDYVIGAKSINDGDITVSVNDLGTDGKKTKFGKGSLPVITDGKKKLALNRDYTVEAFYAKTEDGHTRWQPVGATDIMKAGTEIICKITGKGNYNDTTEDMYTYRYVAKANLAKSAKLVQLNKNILYRGEEVTLVKESDFRIQLGTDTVTKNGKNVKEPHYLKAEEYKIIGYANNNKPGTAKVTVQLLGDYGGVKTFNFTIGKVSMDYKLAFAVGKLDAGATVKGTMRTLSNKDGKFTLPMATFVVTDKNKTKYTFDGWYEDENLSTKLNSEIGAKYQVTDIIEPSETKTLYAKYVKASTLKDYTVTFDGNGGMTKDKAASTKYTQDIKAGANVALKANTFVRPGYKFKGWSTSGSAPVEFNNKQKVLNLGTKTLKAVWKIETYTVTFKGIDKVSEEYTVAKQYSVVDPTKTGYTFAGWTVSIAGKVTDKAAKDFKTKAGETVGNIVLTANWTSAAKKATFTVPTTDPLAQNAKLPAAIDIKSGVAFKLPAAVKAADAERVFVGWVDKSDNKVYAASQSVKFDLTADKAFEAKFADKTYLIKWDLAGGKASNADAYDRYYTNRASKITTVPSVTKLGYTFKEWTLVDGKNSKAIDPTKADAFKDVKKNVTIRAEWVENDQELTITFLKESGVTADSDKATMKLAAGEVKNLDSLMFEKKNYDFAGWKVSAADAAKLGVTETLLVDEAVVSNEGLGSAAITVTLTGTWTPHLYNVTYNLNGAKKGENAALYDVNGKQIPVTFSAGSSASLASSATRAGYDFDGWYVGDAKVATIAVETADDKKTTDVTVTAKWIPKDYTVTLNLDGGTLPDSATTGDDKWTVSGTATHNYTIESGLALPTPTKAHYTFDGWYTESGFKNKVTGIAKGEFGAKELYAKFTPLKKLTITFKDGADGTATQVIYTDDTNVTLTKNAFKKTGNTFKEWKVTSVNGKDPTAAQAKTYEDEASFTLGNLTEDETLELTAQWTPTT